MNLDTHTAFGVIAGQLDSAALQRDLSAPAPQPPLAALADTLGGVHVSLASVHASLTELAEQLGLPIPGDTAQAAHLSRPGAIGLLEDSAEALSLRAIAVLDLSRRLREIV